MNIDLHKRGKNDFEFLFFKLMNNTGLEKKIENLRKHRDIRLATTERRENCLVSEPNYHPTKSFAENLLEIEM